jgi:hypothetical protein
VGGTNPDQPCAGDGDCTGGTCDAEPNCIGGENNGDPCTPETSGPDVLGNAYPTSHDCGLNELLDITSGIGGLPIAFSLTTGAVTLTAVDQPTQKRTFCGFCRDVNIEGSLCFEGNPDKDGVKNCPDSAQCNPSGGATLPGCGTAVPCTSDAGCTAPYESCAQRNPGTFSRGGATRIEVAGQPVSSNECIADGEPHAATLASAFCVPPTFDATVDAAGDLPSAGAVAIQGQTRLRLPPP